MLSYTGKLFAAIEGDLLLDRTYLFEVGGKAERILSDC